ncbi:translation initiation factor IF-2-like [Falco cherrug]|uniref:translation initiation factor IF-2-like n=1 Tax=Falco cherrug TaxID=345164 RepID=UPI00247AC687|nr:translation initiation factor IF-2-like [Falco cherrug]
METTPPQLQPAGRRDLKRQHLTAFHGGTPTGEEMTAPTEPRRSPRELRLSRVQPSSPSPRQAAGMPPRRTAPELRCPFKATAERVKLTGERRAAPRHQLPAEPPPRCQHRRHRQHRGLPSAVAATPLPAASPAPPPRDRPPLAPRPSAAAPPHPARRGGRGAAHVCLRISPGKRRGGRCASPQRLRSARAGATGRSRPTARRGDAGKGLGVSLAGSSLCEPRAEGTNRTVPWRCGRLGWPPDLAAAPTPPGRRSGLRRPGKSRGSCRKATGFPAGGSQGRAGIPLRAGAARGVRGWPRSQGPRLWVRGPWAHQPSVPEQRRPVAPGRGGGGRGAAGRVRRGGGSAQQTPTATPEGFKGDPQGPGTRGLCAGCLRRAVTEPGGSSGRNRGELGPLLRVRKFAPSRAEAVSAEELRQPPADPRESLTQGDGEPEGQPPRVGAGSGTASYCNERQTCWLLLEAC